MKAIDIIRNEHRALAAVLRALDATIADLRAGRRPPDFRLLAAMIDYIVRVPEELHHPKEDEVFFPHVRAACPDAVPIIEELEHQHHRGREHVLRLAMGLIHFQAVGPAAQEGFCAAVERYIAFNWTHIDTEERQLLPLLADRLTPAAWAEIDAAFAANADPWRGAADEFERLFSSITALVPAPLGLGDGGWPA